MKLFVAILVIFLLFSCGTPQKKTNTVVIGKDTTSTSTTTIPKEIVIEPKIPIAYCQQAGNATRHSRVAVAVITPNLE